jgi:hypothetical protein
MPRSRSAARQSPTAVSRVFIRVIRVIRGSDLLLQYDSASAARLDGVGIRRGLKADLSRMEVIFTDLVEEVATTHSEEIRGFGSVPPADNEGPADGAALDIGENGP